jgi:hypothetical protein
VIFGAARAAFAVRPLMSQLWVKIGLDDLETGLPKYPGKVDILRARRQVSNVPICDIAHGISHRVASLCAPRSHFLVL